MSDVTGWTVVTQFRSKPKEIIIVFSNAAVMVIFIGNEFGIVLCSWFTAVSMNYSSLESRLSMLLYNRASSLMYDTAVVSVYVIGCTDVNLHSYRTWPLLLTSLLPCWEPFCLSCPFAAAVWLSCNEIYSALCTHRKPVAVFVSV